MGLIGTEAGCRSLLRHNHTRFGGVDGQLKIKKAKAQRRARRRLSLMIKTSDDIPSEPKLSSASYREEQIKAISDPSPYPSMDHILSSSHSLAIRYDPIHPGSQPHHCSSISERRHSSVSAKTFYPSHPIPFLQSKNPVYSLPQNHHPFSVAENEDIFFDTPRLFLLPSSEYYHSWSSSQIQKTTLWMNLTPFFSR